MWLLHTVSEQLISWTKPLRGNLDGRGPSAGQPLDGKRGSVAVQRVRGRVAKTINLPGEIAHRTNARNLLED
jgi:hypothetical protein